MPIKQNDLDWYAARLAIAVYDTNAEYRMSIQNIRDELKHLPGGSDLTMRYGQSGRTQIFMIGDIAVEVGLREKTKEIFVGAGNTMLSLKLKEDF